MASLVFSFFYIQNLDLRSGEQWERYYSVFTDEVPPLEKLFEEENIPFLSYRRSMVQYNDISGMKSLSLQDIPGRFSNLDPRLDPYMEKVDQLFSVENNGESYSVLYVEKEAISLISLYLRLLGRFSSRDVFWSISGFEPEKVIPAMCLFILFSGVLIGFNRGARLKSAAAMAGWIPLVTLYGNPAILLLLVYSYFALKNRSLLSLSALVVATALFLYFSQNLNNQFLMFFFMGIFSLSLLLARGSVSWKVKKQRSASSPGMRGKIHFRKPEHHLFSPVMISAAPVHNTMIISGESTYLKPFIISLVLIIGLLSFGGKPSPSYYAPLPEPMDGLEWNLTDTGKTSVSRALLTPADYITHLSFQEGFLYGSVWSFPHREKPLLYPVYSRTEKVISKSYETIADYSERWFEERIFSFNSNNPAALLFSTDSPAYVIKKMNHQKSSTFTLLHFSFSVLILLLIIFSDGKSYIKFSFKSQKKLLRRNEQIA